ncbi:hypothetical protein AAY473_006764, partial [Plecturocebus cupreus]
MAHTCNPSSLRSRGGGSQDQEFETSLANIVKPKKPSRWHRVILSAGLDMTVFHHNTSDSFILTLLLRQNLTLFPRLECSGAVVAHCGLNHLTSIEIRSSSVEQAGLKPLSSSNPPTSASQSAGVTGLSHCVQHHFIPFLSSSLFPPLEFLVWSQNSDIPAGQHPVCNRNHSSQGMEGSIFSCGAVSLLGSFSCHTPSMTHRRCWFGDKYAFILDSSSWIQSSHGLELGPIRVPSPGRGLGGEGAGHPCGICSRKQEGESEDEGNPKRQQWDLAWPTKTLWNQKQMGNHVLLSHHFGRPRWEDHLRSGVRDLLTEDGETPSLRGESPFLVKIQNLA